MLPEKKNKSKRVTFDWKCSLTGVASVGTFWKSLSGPLKEILYDFKKPMQENMTHIIAFLTKETREEVLQEKCSFLSNENWDFKKHLSVRLLLENHTTENGPL